MYGLSVNVTVKAVEPPTRVYIEWSSDNEPPTSIEWRLTARREGTYVSVINAGFSGDAETVMDHVRNSTEAFALVLAGAKAFLEHGLELNLVADRHPDGL